MTIALDIQNVLNYLVKKANISEAELSRQINLPRATINRLMCGKTPDPRASTLNSLAGYFNVSVDQLIGKKPLVLDEVQSIVSNVQTYIPIIDWHLSLDWETVVDKINLKIHHDWVLIDLSIDDGKFALRSKGESMWPQFQENSILIVKPSLEVKNRDFVIAYIQHRNEIIFRQLLIEDNYKFLKPINSIFPIIKIEKNDQIIGVVVQVRKNY